MRQLYSYPFAPIQSLYAAVLQTNPVSIRAAGLFCKVTSGRALNRSPESRGSQTSGVLFAFPLQRISRFCKPRFSAAILQLPTAPKLTCSCKFHLRKPTVSLQYNNSFSKKHQSCVCTTVTLSHRFKAFTPPFCRQNRFRHVPPEIIAKSLSAEL